MTIILIVTYYSEKNHYLCFPLIILEREEKKKLTKKQYRERERGFDYLFLVWTRPSVPAIIAYLSFLVKLVHSNPNVPANTL